MAIITLNEEFRVNAHDMGHTLERWKQGGIDLKTGKKGKDRWAFVGHYPNMGQAVRAAVEYGSFTDIETGTLSDLVDRQEVLFQEIESKLKG